MLDIQNRSRDRDQLIKILLTLLLLFLSPGVWAQPECGNQGVVLQVLGSGGPELGDRRASSGYLVWRDGKARILVDLGTGALLRFEQSGASINDLDVILVSHFHVDHVNDLPGLVKASFFSGRDRDLPLYGPGGNARFPSATEFVQALFGPTGPFRYLNSYINGSDSYQLFAHDVDVNRHVPHTVINNSSYRVSAVPVHHGPVPALAWRVQLDNKVLVFSGDMNNDYATLASLAKGADILVAHHAIADSSDRVARNLHMPPEVIGQIAAKAGVKQLVLSHRMLRTLGKEKQSTALIRHKYHGPITFAEDLQCFRP